MDTNLCHAYVDQGLHLPTTSAHPYKQSIDQAYSRRHSSAHSVKHHPHPTLDLAMQARERSLELGCQRRVLHQGTIEADYLCPSQYDLLFLGIFPNEYRSKCKQSYPWFPTFYSQATQSCFCGESK